MKYLLIIAFLRACSCCFSQQDSVIVTTQLPVDSLVIYNQKFVFATTSDSIFKLKVERNETEIESKMKLYSGGKMYETMFPYDPVSAFPAEWSTRKKENPLTIRIAIEKGKCTVMSADGSSTNMLSALAVYSASGKLVSQESCGVLTSRRRK